MRDYYYILGIENNATEAEIKTAYRKLSQKFHLDKNNREQFFEERFNAIQKAYETLSNIAKRKAYDECLKQFRTSKINSESYFNAKHFCGFADLENGDAFRIY